MAGLVDELPAKCRSMAEGLSSKSIARALRTARARRIYRVWRDPEILVVLGEERDHLVITYVFCDCMDYVMNSILRARRRYCYHILAACIANEEGMVSESLYSDSISITRLLLDVIDHGRALSLRKHLSLGYP